MWCTSRCISITIGRCLRLQWPSRIVVDFSAFCWYPMFLACAWEKSEALGNDIPTSLFFCTCAVLQQQNLGPGPCVFLNKTSARGYIWWLATHFHVISIVKWYNVPVVADQSPDHILECASICKVIGVIEPELLLGWTMEHNGTHQTEQQVFVFNPFPQEERLQQPLGFRLQTPSASQFRRQLVR